MDLCRRFPGLATNIARVSLLDADPGRNFYWCARFKRSEITNLIMARTSSLAPAK